MRELVGDGGGWGVRNIGCSRGGACGSREAGRGRAVLGGVSSGEGITSGAGVVGGVAAVVGSGGAAPLDAWRCAMGWSEVAVRSHARRLEKERWLARYPMTRGEGSLFVATRTGVRMLGLPIRPAGPPGPTQGTLHCGCAWTAARLRLRDRRFIGDRELLDDPRWSGQTTWSDSRAAATMVAIDRTSLAQFRAAAGYRSRSSSNRSCSRGSAGSSRCTAHGESNVGSAEHGTSGGDQDGADRIRRSGADRMGRSATHRALRDHHRPDHRSLRADARGPCRGPPTSRSQWAAHRTLRKSA